MKKWLKRLMFAAVCVVVMLLVVSAFSYHMLHGEPEWYTRPPLTAQMRDEAMSRAQTQFSRVEDLATSLRAYEARRQKAIREGTTLPADGLPKPVTVLLAEDELNAVFQTFAKARGWDDDLKEYVTEPTLILQNNRLIFGGKLTDLHIVASAYFEPSIDANGQLHLDLANVMGGKLPLPDMLFDGYRQKVQAALMRRLPPLQHAAKIDKFGVPNDSTVQASLTRLLLQSMQRQPSEPVFFLPLLTAKGTVPVRLTELIVTDGHIQMTIAPMSEPERAAMLERLKEPYPIQTAQK